MATSGTRVGWGPGPPGDVVASLLSEEEAARVNRQVEAANLSDLDEYLDLEDLDHGVQRGRGPPRPLCRVLPRKAVCESTWNAILKWLRSLEV